MRKPRAGNRIRTDDLQHGNVHAADPERERHALSLKKPAAVREHARPRVTTRAAEVSGEVSVSGEGGR
jgi:hypothetical protein